MDKMDENNPTGVSMSRNNMLSWTARLNDTD